MGGIGSGTWCRWDSKSTVDASKRIDIRFMRKHGWLTAGCAGSLSWTRNGNPAGNISFRCFEDYLRLDYRFRSNDEEWESVEQKVFFDHTPCNYGGFRKWFLCPNCNRRVEILCLGGKFFLCRHCYQLSYSSQNEGYMDRIFNEKHKLGERIFEHYEHGEGWGKKKWMHQKTFDRLYLRYRLLENRMYRGMESYLERFKTG